jgi:hypothetical protein
LEVLVKTWGLGTLTRIYFTGVLELNQNPIAVHRSVHVHRRPEVLFFCAFGATSGDLARLPSLKSILPLSAVSRTTVQKEQLSSFPFGFAAGE